ncbi:MAG: MAPEG family protein [Rhodospirillaceae bacterium]|nr:MAPEG family protein [Rhodospirillaceae bacterium]
MPILLPVTLGTASILALIYVGLALRIVQGRFKYRVSLGDGNNSDLQARIRTHGNFGEYVPLLLIFLGLFELAGIDKNTLTILAAVLVIARILHIIGIPRRSPNPFRFLGTVGTVGLIIAASVYGLKLALG